MPPSRRANRRGSRPPAGAAGHEPALVAARPVARPPATDPGRDPCPGRGAGDRGRPDATERMTIVAKSEISVTTDPDVDAIRDSCRRAISALRGSRKELA